MIKKLIQRLEPNPNWFIVNVQKSALNFPTLYFYLVDDLELPKDKNRLILGGSLNYYYNLPLFSERCEIFENLYIPYDLQSKNFTIKHGALLWSRINLYAHTYLDNPQVVFIRNRENTKFIAKFVFNDDSIELYELINDYIE